MCVADAVVSSSYGRTLNRMAATLDPSMDIAGMDIAGLHNIHRRVDTRSVTSAIVRMQHVRVSGRRVLIGLDMYTRSPAIASGLNIRIQKGLGHVQDMS